MSSRQFPEMPCQELVEVVTDYVEGLMSPVDRTRFEAHLEECPPCREYLAQFRAVVAAAGRESAEDLPENEREDLRLAFRQWAATDRP
jgi:anti-sigma factor RsiW